MSDLKTQPTGASVLEFLNSVEHKKRREDGLRLLEIFKEVTGREPIMWGPSIVGFGIYKYTYPDGRQIDWMMSGFSPRKHNLSLYISAGFSRNEALRNQLGKHKTSVACLYINKLEDVDIDVLKEIIAKNHRYIREKFEVVE